MTNPICKKCNKKLENGFHLSALGTCPSCVAEWILDYKKMHDRRYGKRKV